MAARSNTLLRALGLGLAVVGLGLGFWGYQESQSLGNEIAATVGGGLSDEVIGLYIGGAACLAVGVFLLTRR